MILYRPVGLEELTLIAQAGYRSFPAQLAEPPIAYPILNLDYASHVAESVKTKDAEAGYAGFVAEFEISEQYARQFAVKSVGIRRRHRELLVPIEEFHNFNTRILGHIKVIAAFYGKQFRGMVNPVTALPTFISPVL